MKNIASLIYIILFTFFTFQYAHALCVCIHGANLRAGPGTKYPITWNVSKYMPFVKVGTSLNGDWYAVRDVDGDVHWIYKTLITEKYKGAVVIKDGINIRTGPGTKYRKTYLQKADKYYTFKVLERKGSWVKLKDPVGDIGWIHKKFLWIR